MSFLQLFQVIGSEAKLLRRLGFDSQPDWHAAYLPINKLRNRIAHPVQPLLGADGELQWLVEIGRRTEDLLARTSEIAGEK